MKEPATVTLRAVYIVNRGKALSAFVWKGDIMRVRVRQKAKGKGNPWWVFISHNGKRTSRKVGDKKATEEVASTIRAKLKLGEFDFEQPKLTPTFKEHAELWLSLPHDWKESTRENYLNNLNNHILPVFGLMPVNEIKRKDLKFFFDKKYAEGRNPKP